MSELRSALDELRSEVLSGIADAALEADFAELQRVSELLELEKLRRLAEISRRGLHERDGFVSATSWLRSRFRVSGGAAREVVRTAYALEAMPETRGAVQDGTISLSAAQVLAHAHGVDPEAFSNVESALVQAAKLHTADDLKRVVGFWRERVQRDRLDPREGRRLHASLTLSGMVRVDGDLDPEAGETLLSALAAVMDADARSGEDESRTHAQRRADALQEICRSYLDRTDRPAVAGERPHLVLTVPIDAFGVFEGSAEFDRVGAVGAEVARRIACDASVRRVVMAGNSEPLDVGRATPVVPPAIRRAVTLRDRRCRFPGCDRHHAWCDAHHVVHWARGGPTALGNLVLLCRRHHRAVHGRGFTLTMEGAHPVFRRPDGTRLEDRAPP